MDLPPQSKYWTVPIPHGSLLSPFISKFMSFPPLPTSYHILKLWQPFICLSFLRCCHFKNVTKMESRSTLTFGIGCFNSVLLPEDSSKFLHILIVHSFYCLVVFHAMAYLHSTCLACLHSTFFNHSPDEGHLGWFHLGAIMNHATMNICVQIFRWP